MYRSSDHSLFKEFECFKFLNNVNKHSSRYMYILVYINEAYYYYSYVDNFLAFSAQPNITQSQSVS